MCGYDPIYWLERELQAEIEAKVSELESRCKCEQEPESSAYLQQQEKTNIV